MRIGVLDSTGNFQNHFFKNKNIKVLDEIYKNDAVPDLLGFTHSEYVCSYIAKENPEAEIILLPIINKNRKCSVQDLIDGINLLVKYQVDIINMSIGDEYKYHKELEDTCRNAFEHGIMLIAAYSNNNVQHTYPAAYPFVVGVKCLNEKNPKHIIQYDKKNNDIIFSSNYFSLYHLGIPKLYQGNSFACAIVSGLLSRAKDFYQTFITEFSKSKLNQYYPYQTLKEKKCCFLTNRLDQALEKKFIAEITNSVICCRFSEEIGKSVIPKALHGEWQVLFIDHDNYEKLETLKADLYKYIILNKNIEVVLRYPLYGLYERFEFFIQYKTIINQFFI